MRSKVIIWVVLFGIFALVVLVAFDKTTTTNITNNQTGTRSGFLTDILSNLNPAKLIAGIFG